MENKKKVLIFISILSLIESILFFAILATMEKDPRKALFLGLSGNRLFLLGLITFIAVISIFLLIGFRKKDQYPLISRIELWINNKKFLSVILTLFLLIVMWGISALVWNFFYEQYSAILNRLYPVLLLYLIFVTQLFVYLLFLNPMIINLFDKFYQSKDKQKIAYIFLGLSFLIGLFSLNISLYNHTDEGDVLSVGWLISEGFGLYKDVFSHHFPFPYYWVAGIIKIFGPSIFILRFSLLILRTFIFFLAIRQSRYYFSLGLTSITWSLISFLYLGNMLLYDTFAGLFLILAFSIALSGLNKKIDFTYKNIIIVGLSLSFAFLSDPLKVFPGIVIILMAGIGLIHKNRVSKKEYWKRFFVLMVSGLIPILLFLSLLTISSTLLEFKQSVFDFNSITYARYSGHIKTSFFTAQIKSGFDVFNPMWRKNIDPFFSWENFLEIDRSLYTGLFYRMAVWFLIIFYLSKRRLVTVVMVFLYVATNLIRAREAFHASPFVLLSVFLALLLVEEVLEKYRNNIHKKSLIQDVRMGFHALFLILILINVFWLNFRVIDYFIKNTNDFTYQGNFSRFENQVKEIQSVSCNMDDVRFLTYPVYPEVIFWGKFQPASRYLFLFPWVVDAYADEVIQDLSTPQQASLVFINKTVCIWNVYCVNDYAEKIIQYLDSSFVKLSDYYYASPELAENCDLNEK